MDLAEEHDLPVVVVQHEYPEGAPVFAVGSDGWALHPDVEARLDPSWRRATKQNGSVFAGTDVAGWLSDHDVDTITIVGFMTNNCDLATSADAEALELSVEVLSDATGAINLSNEAGSVSARQVHETLMVLLHSNFAAVATTADWTEAVKSGEALPASNLVVSAAQGNESARPTA